MTDSHYDFKKLHQMPFRSLVFDAAFFIATLTGCVICLPGLLLPRRMFLAIVRGWLGTVALLERGILGLDYEVRGLENLPREGAYLVAAKHQSTYETLKLHFLFGDPSIILKRELLWIPLWGQYLAKSDVIAIDRGSREKAMKSIADGALRVMKQGRPIVIFPQGTRVAAHQTAKDRPYKAGIVRIQEATGLPIIPMALNTGLFWPRRNWRKRSGKVVFEFLEPIAPGLERGVLMELLEQRIESATCHLMDEAIALDKHRKPANSKRRAFIWTLTALVLAVIYSSAWFASAHALRSLAIEKIVELKHGKAPLSDIVISGFPGPLTFTLAREEIEIESGTISVQGLTLKGWPVPGIPFYLTAETANYHEPGWPQAMIFSEPVAQMSFWPDTLTIEDLVLPAVKAENDDGDYEIGGTGSINFTQQPIPALQLEILLRNHHDLIEALQERGAIDNKKSYLVSLILSSFLKEDGLAHIPVSQKGQKLYVGPLPVAYVPDASRPLRRNPPDPRQ